MNKLCHILIKQNKKINSMVNHVFYLIWKCCRVGGLVYDLFNSCFIFDLIFYFILFFFINSEQSIVYIFVLCKYIFKYLFLLSENQRVFIIIISFFLSLLNFSWFPCFRICSMIKNENPEIPQIIFWFVKQIIPMDKNCNY